MVLWHSKRYGLVGESVHRRSTAITASLTQSNATIWKFELEGGLAFPEDERKLAVQFAFEVADGFVNAVRRPSDMYAASGARANAATLVVIETQQPVTGTCTITATQFPN